MTDKSQKRNQRLSRSADLIADAAFTLCKKSLKETPEHSPDAKELKELCTAVKEAIAISSALEKNTPNVDEIRIVMENFPEEYAQ